MSHAEQTLHDFVLNLLTDDAARSAFAADPAAALAGAGLQDVTAQDVQEVVPLVLDYSPLPGADVLDVDLTALPGADAIEQLKAVAEAGQWSSAQSFSTDGFAVASSSPTGDFAASGAYSADSFTTAGAFSNEHASAAWDVSGNAEGVVAHGASESPLGKFAFDSSDFEVPNDPCDVLDSPVAGKGEAAAGAVAGYVTAGGDAFAQAVTDGAGTLGGYLTGAGPALPNVPNGLDAGQLPQVPHVPEPLDVPALPEVPVSVPAVPLPTDLPAAELPTDLPDLPVVNPLPDVTSHLPSLPQLPDVTSHLPSLPDVPSGSIGHSPAGDVLPDLPDLPDVGDLHLGL